MIYQYQELTRLWAPGWGAGWGRRECSCPVYILDKGLDKPVKITGMNKSAPVSNQSQQEYERLCRRLAQVGYLSHGSVQDRTARRGGGAGYQWTRKVAQKTVTVSLTAEQYAKMKTAIANYRRLRGQLKTMEQLSRRIIFQTTPHPSRRKHLAKKVLGTN